jgi:hypothetical protein
MAKHKTGASENTCHLLALTLTHDQNGQTNLPLLSRPSSERHPTLGASQSLGLP